jgi:hypothetical protein
VVRAVKELRDSAKSKWEGRRIKNTQVSKKLAESGVDLGRRRVGAIIEKLGLNRSRVVKLKPQNEEISEEQFAVLRVACCRW